MPLVPPVPPPLLPHGCDKYLEGDDKQWSVMITFPDGTIQWGRKCVVSGKCMYSFNGREV